MDNLPVLLAAAVVGVSIAAPVGPIGLLTIQRSLHGGPARGLATGLGAAVADAVYGAVGAFGVSGVMQALAAARVPLVIGGSAFLLWMARGLWRLQPPAGGPAAAAVAQASDGRHGAAALGRDFATTFALTLSNPATILSFIAVFGSLAGRFAGAPPWALVTGVFAGSAAWWLLLSQSVGRLRHRFDDQAQQRINRGSAVLLAAFAAWQLGGLAVSR